MKVLIEYDEYYLERDRDDLEKSKKEVELERILTGILPDWKLEISTGGAGLCLYDTKTIMLSPESGIAMLLHEITHAQGLAGHDGNFADVLTKNFQNYLEELAEREEKLIAKLEEGAYLRFASANDAAEWLEVTLAQLGLEG